MFGLVLKWLCRSPCHIVLFPRIGPEWRKVISWWMLNLPSHLWNISKAEGGERRKSRCSHSEPDIEKWQVNHGHKNNDSHFLSGFCVSHTELSNLYALSPFSNFLAMSSGYSAGLGARLAQVWPWALTSVSFRIPLYECDYNNSI